MKFHEALGELVNTYDFNENFSSNTNGNRFLCIANTELLSKNQVLIIDFYGLRKVEINLAKNKYYYLKNEADNIQRQYLNSSDWMFFSTWEEMEEAFKESTI